MCPTAYFVVVGTKADLRTSSSVSIEEAEVGFIEGRGRKESGL